MKIRILFLFAFFFFHIFLFAQIKLSKRQITPGISMLVPQDFVLMNDDMLAKKYFSPKKPTATYTNPNAEIDLGVNITTNFWQEQDIPMLKELYKGSLRANYSRVEFLQEKVAKINKRNYVILEFLGYIDDSEEKNTLMGRKSGIARYNYMMYTVVENRIVVINFNCPIRYQAQWQDYAAKMMASIKIKNLKVAEDKKQKP